MKDDTDDTLLGLIIPLVLYATIVTCVAIMSTSYAVFVSMDANKPQPRPPAVHCHDALLTVDYSTRVAESCLKTLESLKSQLEEM